jgi:hypothetical protein
MQLICSTCGEQVKAENVNVQDMVAVCSVCDSVFKFSVDEPKTKRRKIRQPQQIVMRDDDTLHMDFRTNFRLDQNEAFLTFSIMSIVLTIITILMLGKFFDGELTGLLPFFTALISGALYHQVATIFYNKTRIEMDDESIQASRKPLPNLFDQTRDISLSGVESIYSEETALSKKEEYDTPRFNVWAKMVDGNRKVIVTDLIDDYATFIAQRMNERLNYEAELDVSRLADHMQIDHDDTIDETINPSLSMNQYKQS